MALAYTLMYILVNPATKEKKISAYINEDTK